MASSQPNVWFGDVQLKLLLVSHFLSCSAPGDRRQCQSFAMTVPLKDRAATELDASLPLSRGCLQTRMNQD